MKWHIGTNGKVEAIENPGAVEHGEVTAVRCALFPTFGCDPVSGQIYIALDDSVGCIEMHLYREDSEEPEMRVAISNSGFNAMCAMVLSMACTSRGIK